MDDETQRGREHRGQRWLKLGVLVVAWLLLSNLGGRMMLWQVERFAMKPYSIPSSAMEPTLHCAPPASGCEGDTQDRVFVLRFRPFWTPSRRDIVVFDTPPEAALKCGVGGAFVKRIIGLPGERVQVRVHRGAAFVYIDGRRLEEPYVEHDRRDIGPAESFRVPEDAYFVMGDNRAQSCDSRVFGSVPRGSLVGPVVARYWPLDRIGSP